MVQIFNLGHSILIVGYLVRELVVPFGTINYI
jgi:hypothetical protein